VDGGNQAPANWKEKEVVVAGLEKTAGYQSAAPGTVITGEVLSSNVVTIEAESASEACKAVRQFYAGGGLTNPGGSAPAVPAQGTGGGFVGNKMLACKTSSLSEESAMP
jgi:hypothetical protein